jgi:flavin-dependent thymidylate synthase
MAKAILAGYNIDANTINLLYSINNKESSQNAVNPLEKRINKDSLTPETLSAAYARISRSADPIPELRRQAVLEVEKSRRSNQAIIFDLGHSSVAEHAVFNFDILNLSRLGVEFLERFRLASFTEKSQRYITLHGDYVLPDEIKNSTFEKSYKQLIDLQNQTYQKLHQQLLPYFKDKYPKMTEKKRDLNTLDGWAKEDARYVLSLATEAQLGMTVNARTLEYMIAASQSHPLAEIRDLGRQLYELVKEIAPSIVKYPQSTPFLEAMETIYSDSQTKINADSEVTEELNAVCWLNPDIGDKEVLQALGFSIDHLEFKRNTDFKKYETELKKIFGKMKMWDTPPRAFEWLDLKFELILSSSAFAQLKRHRMATLISQPYDISLGSTIPPSIKAINQEKVFDEVIRESETLYNELFKKIPVASPYVLTNAHRRRVLFKMNLREVYHFVRLRADAHAQWDIRKIAEKICDMLKSQLPVTGLLLSGKNHFDEVFRNLESS